MFVLDTPVLASWCLPDETDDRAVASLRRIADEPAIAPVLMWFEIRNVLLTAERRGRLTEVQIANFLKALVDLPISFDHEPDGDVVLSLARKHRLSVYDAAFLELALRKAVPLASLDSALIAAAREEHILIAD